MVRFCTNVQCLYPQKTDTAKTCEQCLGPLSLKENEQTAAHIQYVRRHVPTILLNTIWMLLNIPYVLVLSYEEYNGHTPVTFWPRITPVYVMMILLTIAWSENGAQWLISRCRRNVGPYLFLTTQLIRDLRWYSIMATAALVGCGSSSTYEFACMLGVWHAMYTYELYVRMHRVYGRTWFLSRELWRHTCHDTR